MKLLDVDIFWNLIWIIPVFFAVAAYAFFRRRKILHAVFANPEKARQYVSLSQRKRVFRVLCLFISILCAVVAAAGLTWGRESVPEGPAGHDLMILFDVSKSMLADDVAPTRLAHGKWLVRELLKANPADRFGLIAFAGTSFLQCPLTSDKTSFLQMTDSLDTGTIAYGGTNLQSALENAVRAFEGAEGKHKAVILITDGDELTGNAAAVTEQLASAGIPLFIAGVGNPENPSVIHIIDEKGKSKILTDEQGNAVKSPLNETALAELARKTSGIYVRSTAQDSGFDIMEAGIKKLDYRTKEKKGLTGLRPIEHPVYPLGAALFFLCLYFLTGEAGSKGIRKASLLFVAMLFSFSLSAQTTEEKKEPQKPLTAAEHFNRGVDAQNSNQPDAAAQEYEQAVSAEQNTEVRAKSYQNLGVIAHQGARKKFAEAQDGLKKQNPDSAEKSLDQAVKELDKAESLYRETMKRTGNQTGAIRNQQILLKDRAVAEELKKEIEKLKKLQEEAKKQAQNAKDQQKQKQNQKNQDQQKQQEQQKQAQNAAAQAQQKAKELKDQAQKLDQQNMSQQAEQAEKELQQAQEEQKKGNDKKAEEHLEKALQALQQDEKKDQNKKDQSGKDDQKQKENNKKDQSEQDGKDQKQPQGVPKPAQKAKPLSPGDEKKNMEEKQAEAVLEQMSKDEKEWRDMVKEMQRKHAPMQKPQKDW